MKSQLAIQSSWSRTQPDPPSLDTHTNFHQVPLSPTYSSPRAAPKPPGFKNSTLKGLQSVFHRKPPRSPSATSLHTTYSTGSAPTSIDNHSLHPYAGMPPAPAPVVSNHENFDDEQECPVCLEPLSFSFRLPGEKPHVLPECGHSLHEVRFHSILRYPLLLLMCQICP
jgi:hypothetical protein